MRKTGPSLSAVSRTTIFSVAFLFGCEGVPIAVKDPQAPLEHSGSNSFSFVAIGDTQHPESSCSWPGQETMAALPKAIAALSPAPQFVIHLGDLVEQGRDRGAYTKFKSCYAAVLNRFPFFPTLGNHDDDHGLGIWNYINYLEEQLFIRNVEVGGSDYTQSFTLYYQDDFIDHSLDGDYPSATIIVPSGVSWKTFYAFRFKNSYFISFEQTIPLWSNTPLPWVEKHLNAARSDPAIEHIFVYMHHPLYLSLKLEDDPMIGLFGIRKLYEPLFRQYDVTIVFSGHHHVYSHAYVPDDGTKTRSSQPPSTYPHDGNAVHYVVSGGGSWMDDPSRPELPEKSFDYIQTIAIDNHFVIVHVDGSTVALNVTGVSGTPRRFKTFVIDDFSLEPPHLGGIEP